MRLTRPIVLLIVAASLAIIAEAIVAWRDQLPLWLAIPCGIATGALVLFAGVALDALARSQMRPDRRDITDVRDLQGHNAALLDEHAERLTRAETRLGFLCLQQPLADQMREVARAGERIETWGSVATDLPVWTAAVAGWGSKLEMIQGRLAPDMSAATEPELQAARALLPPAHNFSSPDLKAALIYLVQRERVAAAYDRLQAYGRALAGDDGVWGETDRDHCGHNQNTEVHSRSDL